MTLMHDPHCAWEPGDFVKLECATYWLSNNGGLFATWQINKSTCSHVLSCFIQNSRSVRKNNFFLVYVCTCKILHCIVLDVVVHELLARS